MKRINIPGFRKGKAPRKIIELNYGPDVFLQDAVEILLPRLYEEAVEETQIRPVDQPDADLTEVERGKGATFTFTVDVYPELTLGNYKDLEVEREIVTITDADVENVLKQQQERSAQLVVSERTTVQEETSALSTLSATLTASPSAAEQGEPSVGDRLWRFIPGFEEQLIGFEVGQTSDINVTFQRLTTLRNWRAKTQSFSVTVKELKEKVVPSSMTSSLRISASSIPWKS